MKAPRAKVYRALLDARAVATWMVPTGMTSHVHEFDAREGGSFRISLTYEATRETRGAGRVRLEHADLLGPARRAAARESNPGARNLIAHACDNPFGVALRGGLAPGIRRHDLSVNEDRTHPRHHPERGSRGACGGDVGRIGARPAFAIDARH
jgi:hypothetical protein